MMIKNPFFLFLLIGLFLNISVFGQPELDTSFGSAGKSVVSGFLGGVQDIAIQPDNKIVFVGKCYTIDGPYNVCLGRRNEDGTTDTTFGGAPRPGFALTRITGASASDGWQSNGVALQNDGKIVVVGSSSFGAFSTTIIVVRYNANGTLDTTFGTNGVVRTSYDLNNFSQKVAIQPDGKIVMVGYVKLSDYAYQQLIVRYNSNGTLDETFSNDGFVYLEIPGNYTSGLDIAIQPDGKILTGGVIWTNPANPSPSSAAMLVRLNRDGTFDTTFDGDGIKTVAIGTSATFYYGFTSIAVQGDGKILGLCTNKKLYRFNSDGSLDTSFDSDGESDILFTNSDPNSVAVTPSGRITVGGERTYCDCSLPYLYHVGKYMPDGLPDMSFSGDGFLEIDVSTTTNDFGRIAAYDSNGRVVLGGASATGTVLSPYENGTWSFARLVAGSPAQNVGFTGRVAKIDGKAVANAYLALKDGSQVIAYARTNPFGYFRFANVPSNKTYTLSTVSKNLDFYDRSVLVDNEITNFLVIGE